MRSLALACLLAALHAVAAPAIAQEAKPAPTPWHPSEFPILLWSHGGDEAYMTQLKEAGFNSVMTREEFLPVCAKLGLKAIVMAPKGEAITPEMARRLANHPTVIGFMFHDEPGPEQIVERAPAFHAVREAAPNKLVYVNLALSPKARHALLKEMRPQVLSYDWYQWWFGNPFEEKKRQDVLYGSLTVHQKAARQAGIPLWVWIEVNANSGAGKGRKGELQATNLICLRQSAYSNLACGAKAIQWFNDKLFFNKDQTALSDCGRDVATINLEVRRLANKLLPLAFVQTVHTGPHTGAAWPEAPVRTATDNLLIGVFTSPGKEMAQQAHLLVVNKDIHKAAQAALEFPRAPRSLRLFNKADGTWRALENKPGATLPLEPGSGELIEVNW